MKNLNSILAGTKRSCVDGNDSTSYPNKKSDKPSNHPLYSPMKTPVNNRSLVSVKQPQLFVPCSDISTVIQQTRGPNNKAKTLAVRMYGMDLSGKWILSHSIRFPIATEKQRVELDTQLKPCQPHCMHIGLTHLQLMQASSVYTTAQVRGIVCLLHYHLQMRLCKPTIS